MYVHIYTYVYLKVEVLVTQSCPTLCDPRNCGMPGSSIPEILQKRILELVPIPFSRGSSQPRDWTQHSCTEAYSLLSKPSGKPHMYAYIYISSQQIFLLLTYLPKNVSISCKTHKILMIVSMFLLNTHTH